MMMGNINVSSADPAIAKLLDLLSDPKAAKQAKQLLEQLQAKIEEHRQAASTAAAVAADARNERRIVGEERVAAQRLFEEANAKHEEATRRLAAAEAKERAVADAIAVIRENVEI
jgi:hypothetical protein